MASTADHALPAWFIDKSVSALLDAVVLLGEKVAQLEEQLGTRADAFEREALRTTYAEATLKRVAELASWHTGVGLAAILGTARDAVTVRVRDAVCIVGRRRLSMSFPKIAARLGRDHSTVMVAVARAERRIESDPAFVLLVTRINADLDRDEQSGHRALREDFQS